MWTLQLIQIIICGFLIEVSGVLEWTVIGKVTDYGQNVTLFCKVPNCCPDDAGWDRWTPHQSTLFIDVKTGRSNKKYDGQVLRDGYTLIIQNLTKQDLNVSYSCLYGVTFGERKFLLEEDVFMHMSTTPPTGFSAGELAAVCITGVVVLLSVATFIILWRGRRINYQSDQEMEKFLAEPSAPLGPMLISNITESSADIEWQIPEHNDGLLIEQYQIQYRLANTSAWEEAGTVNGTTNRFTVKGLKEGQDYYFKVTPINSAGHGTSLESVDLTKPLRIITKPSAPVGPMLISNITNSSADIKWQTPEPNDFAPIEQYQIHYRLANTSAWEEAGTVNGTTNRFIVNDLKEGQDYYFKVTPTNSAGHGTSLESVDLTKPLRIIKLPMKLSKEETSTYIEAIQSGMEIRQYVRIQVIGKDGVGKTSLVHRLLGYEKHDGKSTDGIEINRKCKIRTSDGEWILGKDETEISKLKTRIQKAVYDRQKGKEAGYEKAPLHKKHQSKETKSENMLNALESRTVKAIRTETLDEPLEINSDANYTKITSTISNTNSDEKKGDNVILNTKRKTQYKPKKKKSQEQTSDSSNLSRVIKKIVHSEIDDENITDSIIEKMDEILFDAKTDKDKMTADGLVECGIWDFAGQKDYYATHQTFLTPHAIYLLVANIGDDIQAPQHDGGANFDTIGDYIDFWFSSIHCLCVDTAERLLYPPVIMVCTGTDKLLEKVEATKTYRREFHEKLGMQTKSNHSRGIYFISNEIPVEEDFKKLKQHISQIANEMNYFSEECPTRWINLEHALEVLKRSKKMVSSWENILKLAKRNSMGERELVLFLSYHHNIGNIIFFKDIPEFIILQPNWLVRCFRCLVCDDDKHFPTSVTEFAKLKLEGVLSENLIDELFKKDPELQLALLKNRNFILAVMEQFDIIVNPNILKSDNKLYYMPCMIGTTSTLEVIQTKLETQTATCTPWLVLEFEFLPIACYNRILFNYIRKYTVCKEESGRLAIYSGKAVVSLCKADAKLLAICFSKNAIALQIWEWSPANNDLYESLLKELCCIIDDFKKTAIHNLPYEIKAKCSTGDYFRTSGRIRHEELIEQSEKGNTYFCTEHKKWHDKDEIENTWLKHASVIEKRRDKQAAKEKKEKDDKISDTKDSNPILNSWIGQPGDPRGLRPRTEPPFTARITKEEFDSKYYKIKSGLVLVLINTEFCVPGQSLKTSPGRYRDASTISQRFSEIGFEYEIETNLSASATIDWINRVKKGLYTKPVDCFVLIILSYEEDNGFYATDKLISTEDMVNTFNATNCEPLRFKPKIIIMKTTTMSSSRGFGVSYGINVGVSCLSEYHDLLGITTIRLPDLADFLFVNATVPGGSAFINSQLGTPFIQHLSKAIEDMEVNEDFYSVLTSVNKMVGMTYKPEGAEFNGVAQMPRFVSTLTKSVRLMQS